MVFWYLSPHTHCACAKTPTQLTHCAWFFLFCFLSSKFCHQLVTNIFSPKFLLPNQTKLLPHNILLPKFLSPHFCYQSFTTKLLSLDIFSSKFYHQIFYVLFLKNFLHHTSITHTSHISKASHPGLLSQVVGSTCGVWNVFAA